LEINSPKTKLAGKSLKMLLDVVSVLHKYIESHYILVNLILIAVVLTYLYILQPFFLSPLKDIPGPYSHRVSYIPYYNSQRKGEWIQVVRELHMKHGDVVILSPTEISVNGDHKYLHDIYSRNFPKTNFYAQFGNHGKPNMFASTSNDIHLKYKKMLMGNYSKSSVFSKKNSTRANLIVKVGNLVDQVYRSSVTGQEPDYINAKSEDNIHGKGHGTDGKWFNPANKKTNLGIEVYSLFGSLAMDVVSAFEVGRENGTDLLKHPEKRHILVDHRSVAGMGFWTSLMPKFWNLAAGESIRKALEKIEKWQLGIYGAAEENVPKFNKDQNMTSLETLKSHGFKGASAYSFLSDNIFAGHETTAIQLTYLTYELSRTLNLPLQQALIEEIVGTFGKPTSRQDVIDDLDVVDKLPYLSALLDENSRVHTSIPGAEPRVVDRKYEVKLDNTTVTIPKGTQISCQPYSIHRQQDVFPKPDNFIPERWLKYDSESPEEFQERIKRQQNFMMPFGKGIRMCLGMNVAVIEMKLAIANLYWHFNSRICKDWCDVVEYDDQEKLPNVIPMGEHYMGKNQSDEEKMVMFDSYTTRPVNDECWLEWYENK
jgi:cytochrome P450